MQDLIARFNIPQNQLNFFKQKFFQIKVDWTQC